MCERETRCERAGCRYPLLPISCRPRSITGDITIQLSVRPPSCEVVMVVVVVDANRCSFSSIRKSQNPEWILLLSLSTPFLFFMLPRTFLFIFRSFYFLLPFSVTLSLVVVPYAKWVVWLLFQHWMRPLLLCFVLNGSNEPNNFIWQAYYYRCSYSQLASRKPRIFDNNKSIQFVRWTRQLTEKIYCTSSYREKGLREWRYTFEKENQDD